MICAPLGGFNQGIKSKKGKRLRQTLAKQIAALTNSGDTLAARCLAHYGRKLPLREVFLGLYYEALDEWEAAFRGEYGDVKRIPDERFKAFLAKLGERKKTISSIFIGAVDRHDGEAIMELARAVWFFRDKRRPFLPVDRERTLLLFLKTLLEHTGEKRLTIREVAQFLAKEDLVSGKKQIETPADGFSALRRKCKQLGIPLAESRTTRRK